MSKTYSVCLDPGHGVETPGKRSPDGAYRECEFALDMARRIAAILECHGVAVALTRSDEHDVTLAKRVQTANGISGLDLFVSLHSNAAGGGAQWMSARGYEVYTSAGPETAPRNVAARKVLARAREAGVAVRSMKPKHEGWYVCVHTNAPAMLIEHLFHDNKEDVELLSDSAYRAKLAEADARGILDYLGVAWEAEATQEGADAPASSWAAESWQRATRAGVFDGTNPQGPMTREQAAVVLDRLGLIKEGT